MAHRPLGPDERALWARVIAGVRPLRVPSPSPPPPPRAIASPKQPVPPAADMSEPAPSPVRRLGRVPSPRVPPATARPPVPGTLDGGWDRRLRKGARPPDRVIDLHGHTLGEAHAALDAALGDAVGAGDRVLLIVAGRERGEGPRGGIRRSLGDWLAASRHAGRIAAVRAAHPRHGGAGALYLILRRSPAPRG